MQSSGLFRPDGRTKHASPLDPFLAEFLVRLASFASGYRHSTDKQAVVAVTGWDEAFLDALFTSARKRRMLEVAPGGDGRGSPRLQLSPVGKAFLAHVESADDQPDRSTAE